MDLIDSVKVNYPINSISFKFSENFPANSSVPAKIPIAKVKVVRTQTI
jgi:hypothetical protein